ncbi:MAG: hypothetical protein ACI85Q_001357, partial [Salibacteraceae bacterium]
QCKFHRFFYINFFRISNLACGKRMIPFAIE